MNEEQEQEMQGQEMEMMPEQGMEQPGMDDAAAQQQAQIQKIAETAPMPEKPYSYKKIDQFADAMNDFVGAVIPELQATEYNPPEGETKLDGPLPPDVYVPFTVIMGFLVQLDDPAFEKFIMRPEDLISDTALAKGAANFKRMMKDKKLLAALQGPEQEAPEEEPEMSDAEMQSGRMPDETDAEDEEIMNMM